MRITRAVVGVVFGGIMAGCANPLDVSVLAARDDRPIPRARVSRIKSEVDFPYFMGPVGLVEAEVGQTDSAGALHLRDRAGSHLRVQAAGYSPEQMSLGSVSRNRKSIEIRLREKTPDPKSEGGH